MEKNEVAENKVKESEVEEEARNEEEQRLMVRGDVAMKEMEVKMVEQIVAPRKMEGRRLSGE